MPRSYIPPHKRAKNAVVLKREPFAIKYAFFGDSFIRLFGLIEHPSVKVLGFKGASAKGLGRPENENRQEMIRFVRSHDTTLERCIFCFGSVDVHLSYYHKTFVLKESIDLEDIARRYVEFVASLPIAAARRTIEGIYPSPLEDSMVAASACTYGSLVQGEINTVAVSPESKLQARQGRVKAFNRALSRRCEKHGIDYIDLFDEMLDASTLKFREEYRDVSDHNIHIVWETTILTWLEKWPWLAALAPAGFQTKLNRTLQEYLATKSWAERTHVSQRNPIVGGRKYVCTERPQT